jgi:hypothetical protein
MTTLAKCIIQSKYASNSDTTEYTAPTGTRTIIDKLTVSNGSVSAAVLSINMVPSGGTAGATNLTLYKSIAAGDTYTLPEIVGHVLNAGDFVSVKSSAASALVIRMSGRENT